MITDLSLAITWSLFGLASGLFATVLLYRDHRQSRDSILAAVEQAEENLFNDLMLTNLIELGQTRAGRELLRFLGDYYESKLRKETSVPSKKWSDSAYRARMIQAARSLEMVKRGLAQQHADATKMSSSKGDIERLLERLFEEALREAEETTRHEWRSEN